MKTVQDKFIVIRRSANTNAFGLYCIWLLNRMGKVITVCTSKRPEMLAELTLVFKVENELVESLPSQIFGLDFGFELPELKAICPADIVAKIYEEREITISMAKTIAKCEKV